MNGPLRAKLAVINKQLDIDFQRLQSDSLHYYRLTSGEVFAIPSNYQRFWQEPEYFARSLQPFDKVPLQGGIGFGFFMPDYSGYTLTNFRDTFSPARVDVLVTRVDPKEYEADPGAFLEPGLTLQRYSTEPPIIDVKNPEHKWGMTCFRSLLNHREWLTCVGTRATGQDVLWNVMDHPDIYQWFPNPGAYVRYFTRDLAGGVEVSIRMHNSQIIHWREIDDFVWRSLAQWRVNAPTDQPTIK